MMSARLVMTWTDDIRRLSDDVADDVSRNLEDDIN